MDLSQIDATLTKEAKNFVRSSSFLEAVSSLRGEITERKNAEKIISLYIAQVELSISTSVALELCMCMHSFNLNVEVLMEKNININKWDGTQKVSFNNAEALLISFLCFVCPSSSSFLKKIFSF